MANSVALWGKCLKHNGSGVVNNYRLHIHEEPKGKITIKQINYRGTNLPVWADSFGGFFAFFKVYAEHFPVYSGYWLVV